MTTPPTTTTSTSSSFSQPGTSIVSGDSTVGSAERSTRRKRPRTAPYATVSACLLAMISCQQPEPIPAQQDLTDEKIALDDQATPADPDKLQFDSSPEALASRAYVISENSDDLFVVDLRDMSQVAKIPTSIGIGGNANHMSILNQDGTKLYVMASHHNSIAVIDTTTLELTHAIGVGKHPSHANNCYGCGPDGNDELWIVNEDSNSISILNTETETLDTIVHDSLLVPHFVRFSNGSAYVPSIGGNQVTVFDIASREVSDVLVVEGAGEISACAGDPCGFADAQIDGNGILVAAHIETGNVMVYDTLARTRLSDIPGGDKPWAVHVDPFSDDFDTHLMPNWGDATVSVLNRVSLSEVARSLEGDNESYGVNYSPLVPGEAFVLNRTKEQVAVIDRDTGKLIEHLAVGGTTETGSTTADGKHLLLPLSNTNEFAIWDMVSKKEVARFANVGEYPWSVATLAGQNYCH